jgi:hypothetical protein
MELKYKKVKLHLLECLVSEWELAPPGHRIRKETERKGVFFERGMESIIGSKILSHWFTETGLTRAQIEAIFESFVAAKVIRHFEFEDFENEDYSPETFLRLDFDPGFESNARALVRKLNAEDESVPDTNFELGEKMNLTAQGSYPGAVTNTPAQSVIIGIQSNGSGATFVGNRFEVGGARNDKSEKTWWKRPEVFIPIVIAVISIPWLPSLLASLGH